ncbi:MAG TPA: hypothetical protein DCL61_30340 [Cyanobacteria bacterium UBA12227]|nr:hypothetical protein [Cyanobacteria bacterium UBA12227]HAX86104.1 hypothetical protein [Cyanobacteria bacterium UBA11370]HBY79446.1 hypothetical protein [Cyanobacteria bacterium UBA11148]
MSNSIQTWLLPLLVILSNGLFGWLINQLPGKQDLHIPDSAILWVTGGCVVALFILGLVSNQSQPNTTSTNQNWAGFLPLIGGAGLYGLSNSVPADLSTAVLYASLGLFVLGTLLPPVLLLPKKWQRRLIWILPDAGFLITVHFILSHKWKAAVLFWLLTGILALITVSATFFKELRDRLSQKFQTKQAQLTIQLADLIWSKLEIWVWELSSQFQSKYYQNLVYTYRTYRTEGLKTPGTFIPDLDKVFVSLQVAAKSPEHISPALIHKQESIGDLSIWDFLAQTRQETVYKRIVILGSPGSGKTTLLECLTLDYAQNTQRRHHRKVPKLIPVILYLRQIREEITNNPPPNLAQLITKLVKTQESCLKLDPPPQWFEERLAKGKCLVMLDGLDEVADEAERKRVSGWVDQQMQLYQETPFIITSRPFGYRNARLKKVRMCLEVQPFNLEQTEQYLHNWYLQNEILRQGRRDDPGVRLAAKKKANDLIGRIRKFPPLADMAQNPLLLTMIATVHDNQGALPGSRKELYAEICDVLLTRRQDAKGILDHTIKLKADQKKSVLRVLAMELMKQNISRFTLDRAKKLIKRQLAAVAGTSIRQEDFIKHSEQVCGLLVEKEIGHYEFAHLSFQEYLAADQIKETNQEQILIDNINNSWWRETIHLYAAGSDTTNLIRAALANPTVVALTIAHGCLEEGLSIAPEIRQQLERMLEEGMDSADSEMVKCAAEVKLAKRLNKLLRIDDKHQIDLTYITCAEYQLFIDEKLKAGKFHQPDHWKINRFQPGDAIKPITGIRASDAEAFCKWLTQRHSPEEFRYRLPTLTEAQTYKIQHKQLGCWYQDEQKQAIAGIEFEQWQEWQNKLDRELSSDLAHTLTHTRAFARDLASNLTNEVSSTAKLYNNLNLEQANDLSIIHDLIRTHEILLSSICNSTIELIRIGNLTRITNIDTNIAFAIESVQDTILASDFANVRTIERANDLANNLLRTMELSNDLTRARNHANHLMSHLDSILAQARNLDRKLARVYELAYQLTHNLPVKLQYQFKKELTDVYKLTCKLSLELTRYLHQDCIRVRDINSILSRAGELVSDLSNTEELTNNLTRAYNLSSNLKKELSQKRVRVLAWYQNLQTYSSALVNELEGTSDLAKNLVNNWANVPASNLASVGDLFCIRYYWLLIASFSDQLSKNYEKLSKRPKVLKAKKLTRQQCLNLSHEYTGKSNDALKAYAFFMLLDARRAGRIPPCEGIQIVRERVEQ